MNAQTNRFKKYFIVSIFLLSSFMTGFEFIGSIITPFFTKWAGLEYVWIMTLQSWFSAIIFIMEIPTGMIGDKFGNKLSVGLGYLFMLIGTITYTIVPDLRLFFIAEALFAIGVSFCSGADQSLLSNAMRDLGMKDSFSRIQGLKQNFHLAGMMCAGLLTKVVVTALPLNKVFRLGAVGHALALILLIAFIPDSTNGRHHKSFITIIKNAVVQLRERHELRRVSIYIMLIYSIGYFVIWTNQALLTMIGIPETEFGFYRILFTGTEIVITSIAIEIQARVKNKRRFNFILVVFIAVGFIVGAISKTWIGAALFITLSGGIGMSFITIQTGVIDKLINRAEKSTVLSGISMIRRIIIAALNPIVGHFMDINLRLVLVVIGVATLACMLIVPRNTDFTAKAVEED
ncbi:MFS transporter [Candidatus Dojkabacteria bacterium]|nr:MFS transporter [Candidatus Dojkabacteria bacterium]